MASSLVLHPPRADGVVGVQWLFSSERYEGYWTQTAKVKNTTEEGHITDYMPSSHSLS